MCILIFSISFETFFILERIQRDIFINALSANAFEDVFLLYYLSLAFTHPSNMYAVI
jgi:hypothetical protein